MTLHRRREETGVKPPDAPPTADLSSPGDSSRHGSGKLGRFELRQRLSSGAFGVVYRAYDPVLEREVALKVPHAWALQSAEAAGRFLREPKAAAQLRHPHIVPVYDAGFDGENFYVASAFIEGRTLEDASKQEQFDVRRAVAIVLKLAEGLHCAHAQGIVHRDVKPSNVMLDANGEPHLMDFGLARWEQMEEKLTQDGAMLGTPAYMSPEQAGARAGDVGPASDQYSLGVVLYELLCGQRPFSGDQSVAALLAQIREKQPLSPRARNPAIDRDLETACLKAMAKEPSARYSDCRQLADDLRRWVEGEPVQARRMGGVERVLRWTGRNRLLAALTAAVALLLLVVAALAAFLIPLAALPDSGKRPGTGQTADSSMAPSRGAPAAAPAPARSVFGTKGDKRPVGREGAAAVGSETRKPLEAAHPPTNTIEAKSDEASSEKSKRAEAAAQQAPARDSPRDLAGGKSAARPESPAAEPARNAAEAVSTPKSAAMTAPPREDQHIAAMRESYEQHRTLFTDLKNAIRQLGHLKRDLAKENEECSTTVNQQAAAWARHRLLEDEIMKDMNRLQYVPLDQRDRLGLQQRINLQRVESQGYLGQSQQLAARIPPLTQRIAQLSAAVEQKTQERDWRLRTADQLRNQWLFLCDPFGRLGSAAQRRTAEAATKWIVEDANFPPLYLVRGFARTHLQDFDLALQDFAKAAELDPDPAAQWLATVARAYALAKKGDWRLSTAEFAKAIKGNPKTATVHLFRGQAFLSQKKYSEAQRDFQQAVRYDEKSAPARQALALVLAGRPQTQPSRRKEAIEHASAACEETKWSDWICIDTLAMALAADGQFEFAQQRAKQSLLIAPQESRAAVQERLNLYQEEKPYRFD